LQNEPFYFYDVVLAAYLLGIEKEGHEVDPVIGIDPELVPIEIKSGTTITADYFKELRYFSREFPSAPAGALVYAGGENQERSEATVCPVRDMARLMKKLEQRGGL